MNKYICNNCGTETRRLAAPLRCDRCSQQRVGLFKEVDAHAEPSSLSPVDPIASPGMTFVPAPLAPANIGPPAPFAVSRQERDDQLVVSADTPSQGTTSFGSGNLLLCASTPDGGRHEVYVKNRLTIGRAVSNTIRLEGDEEIDRTHAEVELLPDNRFCLRCTGADNQLYVGAVPLREIVLEVGLHFRIGQIQFQCLSGEPAGTGTRHRVTACPYCNASQLPAPSHRPDECPSCRKPILVLELEPQNPPLVIPGQFGKYRIDEFVARGGMGIVLKGRDESHSPVAIKLVSLEGQRDAESIARFQKEIGLMKRVRHPRVVGLIDYGKVGTYDYLIMQWVDGQSLRDRFANSRTKGQHVDFAESLGWFTAVCDGLRAIHAQGIVHRDIKPSNILIDRSGNALITDFGIAKQIDSSQTSLTTTGQLPGTFQYMAPEQFSHPDIVDERTDLYSLGVTFYEGLTGERPQGNWPPASRVNPTVPSWFDETLRSLLATRPDERYSSISALSDDIAHLSRNGRASPTTVSEVRLRGATQGAAPTQTLVRSITLLDGLRQAVFVTARLLWVRICELASRYSARTRFRSGKSGEQSGLPKVPIAVLEPVPEPLIRQRAKGLTKKGVRLVKQARQTENIEERLGLAEEAIQAFVEGLMSLPDFPEATRALEIAYPFLADTAYRCGEKAFREQRLDQAARFFRRALEIDPGHQSADMRLRAIATKRTAYLREADEAVRNGQPKLAARVLDSARLAFPGDVEIELLLSDLQRRVNLINKSIEELIPDLDREKKLCELSRLLAGLEGSGVRISGLKEYQVSLQQRLDSVGVLLESAREGMVRHDYAQAYHFAHEVLKTAADHDEALRIASDASEPLTAQYRILEQATIAISKGEWRIARRWVRQLTGPASQWPAVRQVRAKIERSRRTWKRRVVWGTVALLLVLSAVMVLIVGTVFDWSLSTFMLR